MLRYGEALALASFTGREVDVQENANNRKRLPEWIGELPTDARANAGMSPPRVGPWRLGPGHRRVTRPRGLDASAKSMSSRWW